MKTILYKTKTPNLSSEKKSQETEDKVQIKNYIITGSLLAAPTRALERSTS